MTFKAPAKVDIPDGYCAITLEAHQVWNTDPENPDYSGYQMLLDADATAYGVEFLEPGVSGSGLFSGSYDAFEYKIPENADGDLETQNIVYDGSVTILVPAGTYDYVMINPTPGQQLWVASQNGNMGGRGDDVTFVAGRTYLFLITLGSNGNDRTDLYETTVPENLTVVPGETYANVDWDDTDDAAWNLRWRPYAEGGDGILWNFPTDDLSWLYEWYTVNNDTDTLNWEPTYLDSEHTNIVWYSESWSSANGASDPDNWLISPETALQGTLSFLLGGVTSWPDHIGVYAVIGWDPETGYAPAEEDLILIDEYDCSSDESEATFTADLSQFNGQVGRLVFRHFNSYNNYYVYLDDIKITGPAAPWNYVNDLNATNYTIEGLTPNTKYEVQVQADGTLVEGEWTEIVEFITTTPITNVYILGEVNNQTWAANVGAKMDYNAEDNLYTATVTLDGRNDGYNYFSFTTELAENNDDGGWAYIAPFRFGAVSDGDFLVTDEWLGKPLSLEANGDAYKTPAGEYKLTVDLTSMKLIIEKLTPVIKLGDVNRDGLVNISDVTVLIDHLLSGDFTDSDNFSSANSNVNGDEGINIADVTALIDLLLAN
ncbi:MAG: DUF2436 domain-containing protein [Muribaculaceae bacterium]|nr:DUF2436 domain-containing protein [Muribaculaceae bacterium]